MRRWIPVIIVLLYWFICFGIAIALGYIYRSQLEVQ